MLDEAPLVHAQDHTKSVFFRLDQDFEEEDQLLVIEPGPTVNLSLHLPATSGS